MINLIIDLLSLNVIMSDDSMLSSGHRTALY